MIRNKISKPTFLKRQPLFVLLARSFFYVFSLDRWKHKRNYTQVLNRNILTWLLKQPSWSKYLTMKIENAPLRWVSFCPFCLFRFPFPFSLFWPAKKWHRLHIDKFLNERTRHAKQLSKNRQIMKFTNNQNIHKGRAIFICTISRASIYQNRQNKSHERRSILLFRCCYSHIRWSIMSWKISLLNLLIGKQNSIIWQSLF